MKKEETITEAQEVKQRKITLEEKRLIELRDKINDSELLDEYTMLYTNMMLSYASTLKINFDNLKE